MDPRRPFSAPIERLSLGMQCLDPWQADMLHCQAGAASKAETSVGGLHGRGSGQSWAGGLRCPGPALSSTTVRVLGTDKLSPCQCHCIAASHCPARGHHGIGACAHTFFALGCHPCVLLGRQLESTWRSVMFSFSNPPHPSLLARCGCRLWRRCWHRRRTVMGRRVRLRYQSQSLVGLEAVVRQRARTAPHFNPTL